MIDSSRLRDLIATYRSQAKAPTLHPALRSYHEELADYLESVADAVDCAQLSKGPDKAASTSPS